MTHKITPQQIEDFITLFGGNVTEAITALQAYSPRSKTPSHAKKSTDAIISVQSLTKTYVLSKQRATVLRDITLSIHKGEFIAITGASGSGKSTLLQLIGGLDTPTSGTVTVNGVDINQLGDAKRSTFRNQTIGFIFQFFYLQPFLQISKNVAVPGMFAHSPRAPRQQRVDELLKTVGLEAQKNYLPKQLSGGQIQRVAIARALLNSPKILLADEPTGNLDSANSKAIIDLFRHICNELGTTIVIVTHNPAIARQADREIQLSDGVIV